MFPRVGGGGGGGGKQKSLGTLMGGDPLYFSVTLWISVATYIEESWVDSSLDVCHCFCFPSLV